MYILLGGSLLEIDCLLRKTVVVHIQIDRKMNLETPSFTWELSQAHKQNGSR